MAQAIAVFMPEIPYIKVNIIANRVNKSRLLSQCIGGINMSEYRIIRNAISCNRCGDEIESVSVHNFRWCTCHACAVDGGRSYLRRVGNPGDFTDVSEVIQEDEE